MKKNRIEENKTDKHLAEKNQIEKNLIVDRLTVTYGEKLAVDGVSFSLSPGKIYVIVGESGSGKSTLLRTIGGLLTKEGKIVSGDIWMGEQNLIQLSEKEWCEVHGNKMGYIFQNPEQSLSPLAKIGKQFVECQNMHAKTAGKKSKKEILEDAEELLKELRFENPQRVLKSSILNVWWFATVIMIVLGIAFSLVPSAMWPSVPKIIPEKQLGTAYALIFWVQNWGLMGVPLLIGWVLNTYCKGPVVDGAQTYDYTLPMAIFACFGVLALIVALMLKAEDKKKGYGLQEANIKK